MSTTVTKTNPLGTERIGKLVLTFAVPSIISMVVNALYNIVDQIFIGQGVGYLGNGATNVVMPMTVIAIALSLLIGDGAAAYLSLKLGEGDEKSAARGVGCSISVMAIVGIILCVLFQLFLEPLCRLFGATEDILPYAMEYGRIISYGILFSSIDSGMAGMIRADGSPKSGERISEVLTEEPDLYNVPHAIKEVADGSIDFEQVGFAYPSNPGKEVISDLDIHIKPGETIGVLGGTGSAKSSFAALIPRLYEATRGEVRVGGVPVKDYDMASLRDNVAMVLQKNVLFSGTIKENLRWGKEDATDEEIINACRLAQADEFIRDFPAGYDTHIERGGANVSGGQKQRLCIARALLKKPKILVLDDSTSAVDTKTDALIRKAFREQIPDTTKIIIAQRISSIQDADRILVFDNGRMEAVGTHGELLESSPIYREIYESQTKEGGSDEGRE